MMLKRSNHIPTFTSTAPTQSVQTFRRADLSQKICGTTTLQNICRKYAQAYGPLGRVTKKMCCS